MHFLYVVVAGADCCLHFVGRRIPMRPWYFPWEFAIASRHLACGPVWMPSTQARSAFGPSTTESRLFGLSAQDILLGSFQLFFHLTLSVSWSCRRRDSSAVAARRALSCRCRLSPSSSSMDIMFCCVCRFKSCRMSWTDESSPFYHMYHHHHPRSYHYYHYWNSKYGFLWPTLVLGAITQQYEEMAHPIYGPRQEKKWLAPIRQAKVVIVDNPGGGLATSFLD
jgi:hypothetical protein